MQHSRRIFARQVLPVLFLCTFSFAAISSIASPAYAVLYGAQPSSGKIVQIDPETGSVIRSIPAPDPTFNLVGLSGAQNGDVLLWRDSSGALTQDRLCRIDPMTGAVLSSYYGPSNGAPIQGLSWEHLNDVDYIFTAGRSFGLFSQQTFTTTQFNEIDMSNGGAQSLGGDGFGREFSACHDFMINEFDPITGEILNSFPSPQGIPGLAFDGTFLYTASGNGMLYTLNPDTGAVIRSVPIEGGALSELAIAVPEPIAAFWLGLLLGGRLMLRRQNV